MTPIYVIVEGHGEQKAVPILIRRVASEICGRDDVHVLPPHRVPRGRMLMPDSAELKRAVELGCRKIAQSGTAGAIIVLLDADDDCPAELGPELSRRIARDDVYSAVVLAKREYEAWLIAGVASLRGCRGIPDRVDAPADPESIRGAKEYLEQTFLAPGRVYRETVDQPALTARFGLREARSAPSFDKLCRDLCRLLSQVSNA